MLEMNYDQGTALTGDDDDGRLAYFHLQHFSN